LDTELYIAKRIIFGRNRESRFSRPIVRIAIIGIALGIAVMVLTIAIVTGFQAEIRDKVIGFGAHIQIFNYDSNTSFEPNPIDKNQAFVQVLKNTRGIRHIQMYATKNGIIKTSTDNEGVVLKGVGADYDWGFIKKNLVEGDTFSIGDSTISNKIIISKILSNRLKLALGDKLNIYFITKRKPEYEGAPEKFEKRARNFIIQGVYETGFEEFDKRTVIVDIGQIRKLNYWTEDEIGGFEILVDDFKQLDTLGKTVYENIGQGLNSQTIKEANSTIFSWLDLMDWNAIIVIALMVIVASINMISALLVLILERTNMIGILKALGASNGGIRRIFIYNAAYLIGLGLLWGNIIAIVICFVQQKYGLITLPQETYYISKVPINLVWWHVALLNAATMIVCVLMMILPSFIVTKITPVKAIRFS
jgi:lipoprotein-releasing system permease protein